MCIMRTVTLQGHHRKAASAKSPALRDLNALKVLFKDTV